MKGKKMTTLASLIAIVAAPLYAEPGLKPATQEAGLEPLVQAQQEMPKAKCDFREMACRISDGTAIEIKISDPESKTELVLSGRLHLRVENPDYWFRRPDCMDDCERAHLMQYQAELKSDEKEPRTYLLDLTFFDGVFNNLTILNKSSPKWDFYYLSYLTSTEDRPLNLTALFSWSFPALHDDGRVNSGYARAPVQVVFQKIDSESSRPPEQGRQQK